MSVMFVENVTPLWKLSISSDQQPSLLSIQKTLSLTTIRRPAKTGHRQSHPEGKTMSDMKDLPPGILEAIRNKIGKRMSEGYEVSATLVGPNGEETEISADELKGKKKPRRPIPEAQIVELHDFYERYIQDCPFKPGDLVTPMQNSGIKGAGDPHIVLEVVERPEPILAPDKAGSAAQGIRVNVRTATFYGPEDITMFWHEQQCLEPYTENE